MTQALLRMDDCILGQRKELGLYFLPDQNGSGQAGWLLDKRALTPAGGSEASEGERGRVGGERPHVGLNRVPACCLACLPGAETVKGSIGIGLIAHHRGSVLEGLDRAVQQMALGEKARVNVR